MTTPRLPFRRYLVSFSTRELPHRFADVLVIGSGVAGLSAALAAAGRGLDVLVCAKAQLQLGSTAWAQGGIAAAIGEDDSPQWHARDTLLAGAGLCDEEVVRDIVGSAPEAIDQLIEAGARFDRNAEGRYALTREGGHSRARILHANGDQTGHEIERALLERVLEHRTIRTLEHAFAVDLLTVDGACRGALVWRAKSGLEVIWARATVLATGGAGQLFRETTNPGVATGDGVAMALRAGLRVLDAEFYQFHPTTLYIAGASRALITEAVRGEGARLLDRNGDRFLPAIHPLAELAPRDIVARAMVRRMRETDDTQLYLDARSMPESFFRRRFPHISELCDAFGIDFTTEPIPVRPTAHYMIGGIEADAHGRTALPGLYACGECACTRFHGANRLGSNSLLEGAVVGRRAGAEAANFASDPAMECSFGSPDRIKHEVESKHEPALLDLTDLERSLKATMWFEVGVEREARGLERAIGRLERWISYALDVEQHDRRGLELQNMLTLAMAMAKQALARTESRGAHHRTDFPEPQSRWAGRHSAIDLARLADASR